KRLPQEAQQQEQQRVPMRQRQVPMLQQREQVLRQQEPVRQQVLARVQALLLSYRKQPRQRQR
ncbi:MAG: hypothetical protein WBC08_18360, partial [Rhodoferax sp.]